MRKNLGAKPYLYPQPVFIIAAWGDDGTPNAMNAAWGGISDDTQISMCLSPVHKTVKNILSRGAFTVSMATAEYTAECDYLGIVSGNDVPDKIARAGLHTTASEFVNAPLIDELAVALECRLISYDAATCRMTGEIINVCVDVDYMLPDGGLDVARLQPITFDPFNNTYAVLGSIVGTAFSDGLKIK